MNCRNIRREIEEAAPGKWLSSDVNNHVLSCVVCETLLREQTQLRALVSSLGTVEAPSDFNFRLRARLADSKRGRSQSFVIGNFSLGFGSAAVVAVLLLVGSALMFVSFKNPSETPVAAGMTNAESAVKPSPPVETVATSGTGAVDGSQVDKGAKVDAGAKSFDQPSQKRRNGLRQMAVASRQDINRVNTRDQSSTPADVLKRDQLAGVYPSSAFPIDGGYQSLKVSLDDGRGTSRTISLPTVSFGSQRSLSQNALLASARGAW